MELENPEFPNIDVYRSLEFVFTPWSTLGESAKRRQGWKTVSLSFFTVEEKLAERLHVNLTANGINCYKWNRDLLAGEQLMRRFSEEIGLLDKIVLILSEASLRSYPVHDELERCFKEERDRVTDAEKDGASAFPSALIPLRVDDTVFSKLGYAAIRKLCPCRGSAVPLYSRRAELGHRRRYVSTSVSTDLSSAQVSLSENG